MLHVKRLHKDATLPFRAHATDAGFDLFASQGKMIAPQQWRAVPTGIAVSIDPGKAGFIWPRSGLALNKGVMVLAGLIDSGYRGEIQVILYNADPVKHLSIQAGDKIAQLVIGAAFTDEVIEVEDFLGETDRGEKGFGSTGV